MKNILPTILWLTFFSATGNISFGQDIHFSQFFETPILRNPALAGIFEGDVRVQAVYRNQWNSISTPYQTGSFNGEYKLSIGNGEDFLTVGGQVLYDKAGTVALTSTHLSPVINYHKSLSSSRNMYLSLGFMGGIVQRRFDMSKMTTDNQYNGTGYDPTLSTGENIARPSYMYLDGSAGMSFNSQVGTSPENNFYVGVAYHHFNRASKLSFYSNPDIEMIPKWVGSVGIRMGVTDNSYVTFYGDYSKQGPNVETVGGMLYSYKLDDPETPKYVFHAGGLLRWKDAIIPVVKLESKPMTFALSYDVNMSSLKTASRGRGGLELSISYQASFYHDNDQDLCPRF